MDKGGRNTKKTYPSKHLHIDCTDYFAVNILETNNHTLPKMELQLSLVKIM